MTGQSPFAGVRRGIWIGLLCLCVAQGALAVIETYEFTDPQLELRYQQLSQELRCPKCQNQNIADSNAPISRDLRALLHEQLEAGASDAEILDFMVARYGEFVRYRPAVDKNTWLLWYGPVGLVLLSFIGLAWQLARRRRAVEGSEPTVEEVARLRARLREQDLNKETP